MERPNVFFWTLTYHPQLGLRKKMLFRGPQPRWDNLHQGFQGRIPEANQDLDGLLHVLLTGWIHQLGVHHMWLGEHRSQRQLPRLVGPVGGLRHVYRFLCVDRKRIRLRRQGLK